MGSIHQRLEGQGEGLGHFSLPSSCSGNIFCKWLYSLPPHFLSPADYSSYLAAPYPQLKFSLSSRNTILALVSSGACLLLLVLACWNVLVGSLFTPLSVKNPSLCSLLIHLKQIVSMIRCSTQMGAGGLILLMWFWGKFV